MDANLKDFQIRNFTFSTKILEIIPKISIAVAVLMPYFLPASATETTDEICAQLKNPDLITDNTKNSTIHSTETESVLVLPSVIFGTWLLLVGLGFVWYAFRGLKLPRHHAPQLLHTADKSSEATASASKSEKSPMMHKIALICLGVIFYFLVCGVDSYFQSQTYTVGLCGPLKLSAHWAGWLNRYT